jgi:hypothetical protein
MTIKRFNILIMFKIFRREFDDYTTYRECQLYRRKAGQILEKEEEEEKEKRFSVQ